MDSFFILVLFHYLYKDVYFMWYSLYYIIIYNVYIWDKDYHSLCDYIIIDMIFFFFICCLCISLLSMMLLYKDNYPYVVIEIYFHFMFVFGGVYDNIRDSMFLYFFIYRWLCDKDYLVYYDYLFYVLFGVMGI